MNLWLNIFVKMKAIWREGNPKWGSRTTFRFLAWINSIGLFQLILGLFRFVVLQIRFLVVSSREGFVNHNADCLLYNISIQFNWGLLSWSTGTRAPGSDGIPLDTDSYDNGNKDGHRLSGGGIAGIVVGCTLLAIFIVIIILMRKKRTAPRQSNSPVTQPAAVPQPSSMSLSHVTMQPTNSTGVTILPTNFTDAPPSYEAAIGNPEPSAPPFNPYYR